VLVRPTCVSLPNRDAGTVAPPRRRFWRPVCSEDRRARVEGPSEGRVCRAQATISRACVGCMRLCACATTFPSSASSGHPLSSARIPSREEPATARRTDLGPRSDDAPRRAPPSRRPGCLRPSRHVREWFREGIAPSGPHAGSLAHAAHTLSPAGKVLLMGIARSRRGHPRSVIYREYRRLFNSLDLPCLGLTTQARHRARPTRPSTGTDCPARTDAGRSA